MGKDPSLIAHFRRNSGYYGQISKMRRVSAPPQDYKRTAARKEAVIRKLWLAPLSRHLANGSPMSEGALEWGEILC